MKRLANTVSPRSSLPFLSLLLAGCYASNVVAVEDRAVVTDAAQLVWTPATAADVPGLYESAAIEGDAAVSLRRIYYWFGQDGRYTGAALVDSGDGMAFQTLTGIWQLQDGRLCLDDAAPAELGVAPEHLRLAAAGGTLVLHRVPLQ